MEGIYIDKEQTVTAAQLAAVVRQAGSMLRNAKTDEASIHKKEGLANFVTDYDVAIQKFLMEQLHALLPCASFYGEEDLQGSRGSLDGYCFFIDPIDGTTNFIFDYQFSCVSVGLAYERQMIAGMIYNPYVDELFAAVHKQGFFVNGHKRQMADVPLERGIVAFGCARYNEGDTELLFSMAKQLYLRSLSIRNGGSAALDLSRVAAGRNVLYLELKLQPYDYAAASIMIEEAGGSITQADSTPITLDKPCSILAGSRKAVAQAKEMIEKTARTGI